MVDIVNGRIYYRISNWYCLFKLLPFNSLYIPIWQQMLGVKNKNVIVDEVKVSLSVKNKIFKNIFIMSEKRIVISSGITFPMLLFLVFLIFILVLYLQLFSPFLYVFLHF